MADGDRIVISGIEGLDKWATEKTSRAIYELLAVHFGKNFKQLNKIIDLLASGKTDVSKFFKELGDSPDAMEIWNKHVKDSGEEVQDFGEEVSDSSKKVTKSFKELVTYSKELTMTGLASAFGKMSGIITSSMDTFLDLTRHGINLSSQVEGVASGIGTFTHAAREARMSLNDMAGLTKEYGNILNQFGIQRFSTMARRVGKDMQQFGITTQESAELLAEQLERQRLLGFQNQLSHNQQIKMAQQSMAQTAKFSEALGKSRKELEKQAKSAVESARAQLYLRTVGPESKAALESVQMALGEGADLLIQGFAAPVRTATEAYQGLLAAQATEAAHIFLELGEVVDAGGDTTDMLIEFGSSLKNQGYSVASLNQQFGHLDDSVIHMMISAMNAADSLEAARNRTLKQSEKDAKESAALYKNAKDSITTAYQSVAASFMQNVEIAEMINNLVETVSTILIDLGPPLMDLTKGIVQLTTGLFKLVDWLVVEPLAALSGWISDIKEELGEFSFAKLFEKMSEDFGNSLKLVIIGGLTAFFTGRALISAFKKSILGKLVGAVFGRGKDDDDDDRKSRRSSRGGKSGGKGGGLLGGALGGFAKGIAAFANPMVLKGSVGIGAVGAAIAAVIGVIGAAIAGAAWLTGKALPILQESIQGFEEIDGDKLKDTGEGLAAVGRGGMEFAKGMAAMTGSKLLDALTSGFTGLVSGIGKLFGKQSPMESMIAFSKHSDDIGEAASSMDDFANALQHVSNVMSGMPTGKDMTTMITAINKMNVRKFNEMVALTTPTINTEQTTTMASFSAPVPQITNINQETRAEQAEIPKAPATQTITQVAKEENKLNTKISEQTQILERLAMLMQVNVDESKQIRRALRNMTA